MFSNLTKLSAFAGDYELFNEYTIQALEKQKKQMDGYITYACALGGQKGIPTLVSYETHVFKAIQERFKIQYSEIIIEKLFRLLEKEELGERIIELQENAPDWTESEKYYIALYDQGNDLFYYLHIYADRILIGTVVTNQHMYFVNEKAAAFICVLCDGVLAEGLNNIPMFAKSDSRKCQQYK